LNIGWHAGFETRCLYYGAEARGKDRGEAEKKVAQGSEGNNGVSTSEH